MTENEKIAQIKWLMEKHPVISKDKDFIEPLKDAIQAFEEIQQYRALEQKLQSVYGEHDGLLEIIVNGLVKFDNAPDKAIKAVLLTDDDVERWEQYKEIGTVEEIKKTLHNMSVLLASYTTNGTAEEFKALKEKNNKDFELLLKCVKESYPMFKGAYVELDVFMGDVMRRFTRDRKQS